MSQLYVMIPGNPQPTLLGIDEVARRIRAGELPATANVARLGETSWSPAKELPEIAAKLEGTAASIPGTSPSLAAAPSVAGGSPSAASPSIPGTSPSLPGASPSIPGTSPSIPGTAASPSWAGAPIGTPPGGAAALGTPPVGAPSLGGTAEPSHPGAPTPAPVAASNPAPNAKKPASAGVPKSAILGAGAALGVILVGVVGLAIYRNSYSRGLVLEHLPDDCDELYYADLAGIVTSDPVKPNLERFLKNSRDLAEDEVSKKSKKDKERFERAIEALQKNGVEPTSIRELAFCIPHVDKDDGEKVEDKLLLVVGGTFRKGDVLKGLKEATEAALKDDDACKLEDDDGLRMLKCTPDLIGKKEPVYATLVESRVLAISPDKKTVKSVRTPKDRAKTYSANKGEHIVQYRAKESPKWDGSYGETKLKIGSSDTILTIETHYDEDKGKAKLAQFKDGEELVKKREKARASASEKCFDGKTPLEPLAEAVERTKVEAFDDGIRYEYKVSNKDLGKTFKNLSDADKDDLGKIWKTWFCILDKVEPFLPKYDADD